MRKCNVNTCPICGMVNRFSEAPIGPFCSKRCKMIDLGNWAMETYRVPGEELDDDSKEKLFYVDQRDQNQNV